jgi:Transglycosylase SLT domain
MSRTIARACVALSCSAALIAGGTAAPASAKDARSRPDAVCADKLCREYEPGVTSCWERGGGARSRVSKCFIKRAARHYRQPTSLALYIAHRESRYDFRVTNASSGAAGLYQFMPVTWHSTPYRHHSPYEPRWAALAAMWMWAHGGYHHWAL